MAYSSKPLATTNQPLPNDQLPVPSYYNSSTDAHEPIQGSGGAQFVQLTNRTLTAANKATADGTDKSITTPGFNRVILDCSDCPVEMTFTIDEAISGATKPIYLKAGATLDIDVAGAVLHYRGNGTFRYILV